MVFAKNFKNRIGNVRTLYSVEAIIIFTFEVYEWLELDSIK